LYYFFSFNISQKKNIDNINMILDELKYLIKDLEEILLKDKRFRQDYLFKSQVRKIYEQEIKSQPIYIPYMISAPCPTSKSEITNKPEFTNKLEPPNKSDPTSSSTNINNVLNINNCINLLKPSDDYEEVELDNIKDLLKSQQDAVDITNLYSNRGKLLQLTKDEVEILLKKLDLNDIKGLETRVHLNNFLSIPKYPDWQTFTPNEIKKIIFTESNKLLDSTEKK